MSNKQVFKVGDRVKVIDQEIYGLVVHVHPTEVVIEDANADLFNCLEDKLLRFKKSEVEEVIHDWIIKQEHQDAVVVAVEHYLDTVKPKNGDDCVVQLWHNLKDQEDNIKKQEN
jgi:hypothetical protein